MEVMDLKHEYTVWADAGDEFRVLGEGALRLIDLLVRFELLDGLAVPPHVI